MRQKRKIKIKLIIFGIVFMLFGCSEDLYEKENNFNNKGIKISKVSLKEPRFQNKTKLIQEVNKIKNKQTLASNSHRMVYDSINDFYFDDENGTLIENINGYESYTFKVVRETPIDSKLENVIFSQNQEGDFDTYLAKYPVSEEVIKTLSTEEFENMETDFQILNKAMEYVCITITTYGGCGETHSNGYTCSNESSTSDCYNMGGGSSGGGSSTGGSTGGSGTGSGTSGQGGGISTTPTGGSGGSNSSNKVPCDNLKRKINPTEGNIKPVIETLRATLNQSGENGASLHKGTNNNFQPPQYPPATTTLSISFPQNPTMYGIIHTHPYSGVPIFSFQDVFLLQQIYEGCLSINETEITIMLVVETSIGVFDTYALTIDNPDFFSDSLNADLLSVPGATTNEESIKVLDEALTDKTTKDRNFERVFLQRFSNYGISLFKADTALTKWEKLIIDPAEEELLALSNDKPNVKKIPCPI